jgi:uncharacterized protein
VTEQGAPAARTEPPATATTAPFWEATRERRLLLQWCSGCERPIFYPREECPYCTATSLRWRPASGRGSLYTFTVEHRAPSPLAGGKGPYVIALVDLDEGVRMMANVVNCPLDSLEVGMPLEVTWEQLPDGRCLPLFQPREP